MSNTKNDGLKKRLKITDDAFDIVDATGTIGVRFSDQLSHITIENRRYRNNEKRCDRREGFLTAFPKTMLPDIIDNLARLTLTDKLPCREQFQSDSTPLDGGKQISMWKSRIQNAQDRDEIVSLLRLMVEVGTDEDMRLLMGALGRFVQKHEAKNPHLVEKFMRISEERFPEVVAEADARFWEHLEPVGHA